MPSKKIVCLGGGSLYFARVLGDLAATEGLAGSEIALYDIARDSAELMARHGRRLAQESGTGLVVRATSDLADAVDGADFAIGAISVGGRHLKLAQPPPGTHAHIPRGGTYDTVLHIQDLLIPAKYGIIQMVGDTGGPAGLMMGLRAIPVYLRICREMEKRCPDIVFLQHSNPMAPLCRAMVKQTGLGRIIGICHGVQGGILTVARLLGVDPHALDVRWVGTNHYHWFTQIRHDGKDIYPEVRKKMAARDHLEGEMMTQKLSEIYGYQIVYAPDDHALEFYPFFAKLPGPASAPYGFAQEIAEVYAEFERALGDGASRAEDEAARRADLAETEERLGKLALPDEPSDPLIGEGLGNLIESISLGRERVYVVNVPNEGAVPNLPEHAIVEVKGVSDSTGVRPVSTDPAPLVLKAILEKRIAWQELVADAGATGDRNLALQALLLDEMAILPDESEKMLDELLAASKGYLPQFA